MLMQTDGVAASFDYNGARVELVPENMRQPAPGIYEKTMEDGMTAILVFSRPAPDARTQLLRFEHRGKENSGVLSNVKSFDRVFPLGETTVYESLTGDDCGETSFLPRKERLRQGDSFVTEPKFGRPSDTFAFPFFDLYGADGSAAGAVTLGIGWSGQWRLELSQTAAGLRVAAGLSETETFLYPGEAIRTARMLWVTGAGPAAARRRFRRVLFDHFSPRDPKTGGYVALPIAETNFDRYFRKRDDWATVEGQQRCADAAAACHMDALWLDAAWFREGFPAGVGNDAYAPGFPNGTGEVSAYAHQKGLRYVQWFEPERANAYSDTLRFHREDVIVLEGHNSVNCLVNIGEPRVRRRVTDMVKKHIREDGIDVYRQDYNICPLGYWRTADKPGRRGMTEIRFVEGHYAMWDELLAAFPNVLIDNCASGGRRIDLETTARAVPLWRSDTGCSPETEEKRTVEWSQNQILGLTRYLPYHSSGCWSSAAYDVRSVAAGGAALNYDVLSPAFDPAAVIPAVEEIRRLRPYWYGDFYPLAEPSRSEDVWVSWQLVTGTSGAVYAFRRRDCAESRFSPGLACIDPAARYTVTVTDEALRQTSAIMDGASLAALTFCCEAPRSSVVAEYRRLDAANETKEE